MVSRQCCCAIIMDLTSYSDIPYLNEIIDNLGSERNGMDVQSTTIMCNILRKFDDYPTTQTTYNQIREPIGDISRGGVHTGDDDNMQSSMQNSRMANDFNVLSVIGSGGFGTVFKCQCKANNNLYAIKKVPFEYEKRETVYNELKFLSQLDSKFVVGYIDSWDEENFALIDKYDDEYLQNISSANRLFNPNLRFLLHIQMELCAHTLRDVIKIIIKECSTVKYESLIGYYISSELFIEILECVQYLHEQTPPIIHRDLKPENFLINFVNNRFVKLSDFGLSTFHEYADQSHTAGNIGTTRYIAPEILAQTAYTLDGKMKAKYTTQADCFSLGIILQELFNSVTKRNYLPVLNGKMNKIESLSEELHSLSPNKRPKCDAMLKVFELLRLTDKDIKLDENFNQIVKNSSNSYSINRQFIEFFVHNKYKFSADDNKQSSMQMSRMDSDFNVLSVIGSGGFGTVFKCECKADHNLYAIKIVPFQSDKRESVYKKLNFLSQLDFKFIVKFINSWVEPNFTGIVKYDNNILQNISSNNTLFNPNMQYLLHIQMELCALTLKDVIKKLSKDRTLLIGYYISSELFIEILECVQYIHSQTPPIIHCDLKPKNILINFVNNRFVKLSEFGLSTFHEFDDQSHTAGITEIMPNIAPQSKYTTHADCYSLGIILKELFSFDSSITQRRCLPTLNEKLNKIEALSLELRSHSPSERPNCDAMLKDFELLRLNEEIEWSSRFTQIITNIRNSYSINEFIEFFVHNKYKISARPQTNSNKLIKHI